MRPTRIYSLTLIASAFAFILATGCKKSSNSSSDSISATIGSTNFNGTHTQGAYSSIAGIYVFVSYSVQGKDTTGFFLTVPSGAKAGKTISSDSTFLEVDYITANGTAYDAYSGSGHATMTINTLDTVGHKVSGTFTATAYNESSSTDSVLITNGKFSSSYTVQ